MKKPLGIMQGASDMDYGINRNGSGYYDPTAYKAIKNYMKCEEKRMELYSGDIFKNRLNNGSEKGFVIVSVHDKFSTVLMLSDNENLPFSIKCNGMKYTDPGMLQYVYNDNFTEFVRAMTQPEIDELMKAVIDSLGYEAPVKEVVKEVEVSKEAAPAPVEFVRKGQFMIPETEALKEDLTKAQAERDVYKNLYENLIGSMIAK